MASRPIVRTAWLLASAALLSACADRLPSGAEPEPIPVAAPRVTTRLRCDVRAPSGEVSCTPENASAARAGGPRDVIFSGSGQLMVHGSNMSHDSVAGVFSIQMQVWNRLTRPIGTTDGTTLHPDGVRTFVSWGPSPSSVTLLNPDGVGTFSAPNQPYFEYDEIVGSGQNSSAKTWEFGMPPGGFTGFSFSVDVSTEVPYPDGWVEAHPSGNVMRVGRTVSLSALVRDETGATVTGETVTWSSSDTLVARVDTAGVVRAVAPGLATIQAVTATRPVGLAADINVYPDDLFETVSAGAYHTCALDYAGQAYCWGYSDNGRLGVGAASGQYRIAAAVQHPSGVTFAKISGGGSHTCALTAAGQAYCWGYNLDGRVGDGTTTNRNVPTAVQHPSGVTFTEISAGGGHSCALSPAGQAYCWGQNSDGQLGDATTTDRSVPTAVVHPTGVTFATVRAGGFHSCAATSGGQAYCWGANDQGQVGDSTTTARNAPVAVKQPAGVWLPALATGYVHSCGLVTTGSAAGQAYCWGRNASGQLGNNSFVNRPAPVAVQQGTATFALVTAGMNHTCALAWSGAAHCWGANTRGQVGDGSFTARLAPVTVPQPGGSSFTSLSTGLLFTCAVRDSIQGYCWGANGSGQVGDSTLVDRGLPVPAWH